MDLIVATDRGLYCAAGDFHIDPWRPVARAVITHGHSDHARFGSEVYVCHPDTAPILRKRLGDVAIETAAYGEILTRERGRAFAPSGGPCAGLGAGARRASRRGLGRVGRLQARERRGVGRFRAAALRRVHHRIDLRPADLSLAPAGGDHRLDRRLVARERRGGPRERALRLCARQGAARARACRRRDRADRLPWRGRAVQRDCRAPPASPCRRRGWRARSRPRRHSRAR